MHPPTRPDDPMLAQIANPHCRNDAPNHYRSWPFRTLRGCRWLTSRLFGIASVIFLTATAASIPIVQLMSFGYLLEVVGRLARGGNFSSAMIGLTKASHLGGIILGTWLLLLPVRFISLLWYEAYLIDPASNQTLFFRILQITLTGLMIFQIMAAWICGGKLRYFFWQAIAPLSFSIWILKRSANTKRVRLILSKCLNWISPHFVQDLCKVRPVTDWFVPAIIIKKIVRRTIYTDMRDGLWAFMASLNLSYYFKLGLKGFSGTFLWLLTPTILMMASTARDDAISILSAILGFGLAVPLFAILPFIQAHFARTGRMSSFLELPSVMRYFFRSPIAHVIALLMTFILALPLFLLKIEEIPQELLWTLSLVFVTFTWPAKIAVGLACRRGSRPDKTIRWWIAIPMVLLTTPISFAFIVIMFFTRYVTWNGMWSLLENHVFLLPAPFWL